MRIRGLALLAAMGCAAWGQNTPAPAEVDRAAAYYHYTLAHMYAELAGSPGGSTRENITKAIEQARSRAGYIPGRGPVVKERVSG